MPDTDGETTELRRLRHSKMTYWILAVIALNVGAAIVHLYVLGVL